MTREVITRADVEISELTDKVMRMYRDVATNPGAGFHLEIGRSMTTRLRSKRLGSTSKEIRENSKHRFLSDRAQGAWARFGVKSVSLIAERR